MNILRFHMQVLIGLWITTSASHGAEGQLALQRLATFSITDDGTQPGSLIEGADGFLYGTTSGSLFTNGTVFRLTPGGGFTVMASFDPDGTNGYDPTALAQSTDGTFYGTTRFTENAAGPNRGTVFKLTLAGELTTVAVFEEADGFWPNSLIRGHDGNFYGTTVNSVFKVTTDGELSAVFLFPETDRTYPTDAVIQGQDGNLYGTAEVNTSMAAAIVFKLTPSGDFTRLMSFNRDNGIQPRALLQGVGGDLYGALSGGEPDDYGCIFKLTTNGALTTLVSFNGPNGIGPVSLVRGRDGNLYGTAYSGGPDFDPAEERSGSGTIFKLTLAGELTTLTSLQRMAGDGLYNLVHSTEGIIYGRTRADPYPAGILRLAPKPLISELQRIGGADVLRWCSFTGAVYQIEQRATLAAASWTASAPEIVAAGSEVSATNINGATPERFYRIRLLP